jgi:hypothetical protein
VNVDEQLIARFLKGAYNENKPRFKSRFVDFYKSYFKAIDKEYFSDIIDNIEYAWDLVKPFSYKEAFELQDRTFRALVFSSINVTEMVKELGTTRAKVEGKELINKTWNPYLQKFEEVPYTVIYELHYVNGEKLGLREGTKLPIVKCWCTTTNNEHWLWVTDESFKNDSPLEAIASTCVIYKSMYGKIKHIIRQGDVFLFEMTEDVTPSESEDTMTLSMNEYFSLLKSQA